MIDDQFLYKSGFGKSKKEGEDKCIDDNVVKTQLTRREKVHCIICINALFVFCNVVITVLQCVMEIPPHDL